MAYRIGYRSTQGQQSQTATGGGFLLDQYKMSWVTQASNALPVSLPVGIIPQFDTADFGSSILGDYEPLTQTPHPRIGRVTLAFSISIASVASTSAPVVTLNRVRSEPASAPTSTSIAAIATFDLSAFTVSLPWFGYSVSGSLVSNGVLNAGDVLVFNASAVSNSVSLPAGTLLVDIEA